MNRMRRILSVCDGDRQIGTGHVMRQITLSHALNLTGVCKPELFCHSIPPVLEDRARRFGIDVNPRVHRQDDTRLFDEIIEKSPDLVIFDGYRFDVTTVNGVHAAGIPTVVVDDNGEFRAVSCTALLNQNLHAEQSLYTSRSTTRLLTMLGPTWALVREEVVASAGSSNEKDPRTIFVSVGGADHLQLAEHIKRELEHLDVDITVAGGFFGANPLTLDESAALMARATLAVIACGTTVWEACLLGLPFVGLITVDNQAHVGASLREQGLGEIIDCREHLDVEAITSAVQELLRSGKRRTDLSARLRSVVDGRGAYRVAANISDLAQAGARLHD